MSPGTPSTVWPLRNASAFPMIALMQLSEPFFTFSLLASRWPARHPIASCVVLLPQFIPAKMAFAHPGPTE